MYTALNNLDRSIEKILGADFFENCFYIEAGANDGINQSNTFFMERTYNAKGLLVEALPPVFQELVTRRSPINIFENCALVSDSYTEDTCDIMYSNLMSVNLSDDDDDLPVDKKQHAENGYKWVAKGNKGEIFKVKARTLQSILDEHNITEVDIFSLDVEGNEFSVLNGIDFDKTNIKSFLIEIRDLDRIKSFLNDRGYQEPVKISVHDYLFVKEGISLTL